LFAKTDLGEICYGDERWLEVSQDRTKMWALLLAGLNLLVLLPELVSKTDMSWGWEVDGTGSQSCQVAGCGTKRFQSSCFVIQDI
jgi:hypothetical protein